MSEQIFSPEEVTNLNNLSDAVADRLAANPSLRSSIDGRDVETLNTPLGKQVVIKTYLNPIERRAIRLAYSRNVKTVTDSDGNSHFEIIEGRDIVSASEDALIKEAVVSYDGSGENIIDRLLVADSREYNFILNHCNGIGKDPK